MLLLLKCSGYFPRRIIRVRITVICKSALTRYVLQVIFFAKLMFHHGIILFASIASVAQFAIFGIRASSALRVYAPSIIIVSSVPFEELLKQRGFPADITLCCTCALKYSYNICFI